MGYPGALPVINKEAIKKVIQVGLAINAKIATFTEFDRKHYFYPDIPKGYQISQYKSPIVSDGLLNGVRVQRIHLEEDTAKSSHDTEGVSLVDFNRAGVPLMELVTYPDIHSAEQAGAFGEELQLLLRTLGASNARMEWGEMRVEVNISVSKTEHFGTKVEIKNLNSFKVVRDAIAYEIERQIAVLESGEKVVQETRGWNDGTRKTVSQRIKESSEEYRYMPDPDIPKFDLSAVPEFNLEALRASLPTLPSARRELYTKQYQLTEKMANVIVNHFEASRVYDDAVAFAGEANALKIANYLTSDVMGYGAELGEKLFAHLTGKHLGIVIKMIDDGKLSSRGAKDLLKMLATTGGDAEKLAQEHNLIQSNDTGALVGIVHEVIKQNEKIVNEYKAGKEASLQFLVGQVMKVSKGTANPQLAQQTLKTELAK